MYRTKPKERKTTKSIAEKSQLRNYGNVTEHSQINILLLKCYDKVVASLGVKVYK